MSMILLEPAYKILHATGEVQAADHLSKGNIAGSSTASSRHPLAARFAQMAIARKSKNARGWITGSYGVYRE
jgi:hypothetical protein